jgi:hypothetical protein
MFQHLLYPDANVLAFISNLGPNNKPKNAQSWPQVFWALTPGVTQALVFFREEK